MMVDTNISIHLYLLFKLCEETPMPTFETPTKICKNTPILPVKISTQLEEILISPRLACVQIYHLLDYQVV